MRYSRAVIVMGVALVLATTIAPLVANAATEAEKQAAIDKALVNLALTQQAGGSWSYGGYEVASTGSAMLAFEGQGFFAGTDVVINAVNYGDVVGKALDYLTSQTMQTSTAAKPAADTHGANSYGVHWDQGNEDIYTSGIATVALAFSNVPGRVITNGTEAGRTVKDLVGDAVDYFALAQVTAAQAAAGGNAGFEGGWRYVYPSNNADNSTSQWPVLAMEAAANKMGVTGPQFVKDELKKWIDYIQNPTSGGSGYDSPTYLVDESKTGGLLVEMAFAGSDLSNVPYTTAHPDVIAAMNYLNTTWLNGAGSHDAPWGGDFGHPYAMWSVYKGLQGMIGLDVTSSQYITNLHADPGDVDNPNHGYNWWEDYCEYLVSTQNGDGSWSGYSYWYGPLATAWYTNILAATIVVGPAIPEPLTCGAIMLGLGGLCGYVRRRLRAA